MQFCDLLRPASGSEMARLRDQPPTIFDVFCEIVAEERKPRIAWKYPEDFDDQRTLRSIVEFGFPTFTLDGEAVQLFTFVLTDNQSRYSFGYCRHTPAKNSCICVLSALPWTDVFYRFLNHLAGMLRTSGQLSNEAEMLLVRAYHQEIPNAGDRLVLDCGLGTSRVEFPCPDDKILPRIPENRNLTEYYNAVCEENMLAVFASLLHERRVMFVSSKLGKLSACVLAASALLYPMHWQYILIPVLPEHLLSFLSAPMPFLIGVPAFLYAQRHSWRDPDFGEVVVLDVDNDKFSSPFNDFDDLPGEMVHVLRKQLRSSNHLVGDGLSRSFLRALVVILGNYRDALKFCSGETITFSEEAFIAGRSPAMKRFCEKMLHWQIFRQFLEERLAILNAGEDPRDEFEEECSLYSSKDYHRFRSQYNEWMINMRKEGGALIKQWSNKVKSKGRDALSDIRTKLAEMKESSPGDRRTPPPQSFFRRINSSPNRSRVILREETDSLTGELQKPTEDRTSLGAGIFGVGAMDLLSELQYLMARPSSFIERLENQQKLQSAAEPADEAKEEPLVAIEKDCKPPEELLIDFGLEQKAAQLQMDDFDPLAPKTPKLEVASKPVSSSHSLQDFGADIDTRTASAKRWETFD